MILDDISAKLHEVDSRVYYGMVDNEVRETVWDYIVFNRSTFAAAQNRTGYSDYYDVHIIRENFIPEELDTEVIAKMSEIPGVRLVGEDGRYDYLQKSKTDTVVEILTLTFVRARK